MDELVQNTLKRWELECLLQIMQGWPNSYTFSKAVCEDMLVEEGKNLPLCIFRPAVVGPTYLEPVRGWTDNLYGPIGMCVAIGLGVVHCWKLHKDLFLDIVQADFVVNCMIAAAWKTHTCRTEHIAVYNFTATPEKLPDWKEAYNAGLNYKDLWPYSDAIYYPAFFTTTSRSLDRLMHFVLHKIPGKIIDFAAIRMGSKPRLSKVYDRISVLKDPLEWFSGRIWEFKKENVQSLWSSMSNEDKRLFYFDHVEVNSTLHLLISKLAVRYYVLNEAMETLPYASTKVKCLRWVHRFVQLTFGYATLKGLAWAAHYVPL